jgi:hypothetical protein
MGFPDKMLISKRTKGRLGSATMFCSANCMATLGFFDVEVKDLKVSRSPSWPSGS